VNAGSRRPGNKNISSVLPEAQGLSQPHKVTEKDILENLDLDGNIILRKTIICRVGEVPFLLHVRVNLFKRWTCGGLS
jgi:hypothetical protein